MSAEFCQDSVALRTAVYTPAASGPSFLIASEGPDSESLSLTRNGKGRLLPDWYSNPQLFFILSAVAPPLTFYWVISEIEAWGRWGGGGGESMTYLSPLWKWFYPRCVTCWTSLYQSLTIEALPLARAFCSDVVRSELHTSPTRWEESSGSPGHSVICFRWCGSCNPIVSVFGDVDFAVMVSVSGDVDLAMIMVSQCFRCGSCNHGLFPM